MRYVCLDRMGLGMVLGERATGIECSIIFCVLYDSIDLTETP